jgi:SRSO17 transposase
VTKRISCPPAPGPLEEFAALFDDLFASLAQRRSWREYLQGLLLPRDRNKTLTALVGAEPIVEAQHPAVQRLQWFVSESKWNDEGLNRRRLEIAFADPDTAPHEDGVLVIDDSGDRKDGSKTDHVARQYLGSLGKVDNGIVAVTSLWADERVYYPLHVQPYTPASRLPEGKKDLAFRTKPQIALELVDEALDAGLPFRAVVADCIYGENDDFEGELGEASLPYVVGLKPSKGFWAPAEAAHTPKEVAQELRWASPDDPGDWTRIERCFRGGHLETWWAAELTLGGYGPEQPRRLVVATTDPATLPDLTTWYLTTNLPRPSSPQAEQVPFPPADLAEVVRIYGLRNWVEQSYKQVKHELGWADFMVRSDQAIRRHWQLVCCAFSFCWHSLFRSRPTAAEATGPPLPEARRDARAQSEASAVGEPVIGGKNRAGKSGHPSRPTMGSGPNVAHRPTPGASLAATMDFPTALLASVVRHAPASRSAGPTRCTCQRPCPEPLSPRITKYR